MTEIELARQMKRLTIHLDAQKADANLTRLHLSNPPLADTYLTLDSERQTPFPSSNRNKLCLWGCEEGESEEFLDRVTAPFHDRGIERFFVHLSPGEKIERMRLLLEAAGMTRFGGTGYPTLIRESHGPAPFQTDFTVREIAPDEIPTLAAQLDATVGPTTRADFAATLGKPGFTHFAAFDGQSPVAVGVLCVFENMGYLTNGATAETHRRRGAQQAIIAHRLAKAEALGCAFCVSETLYMLTSSFQNLQRAGFREIYAKEVYVGR